MSGLFGGAKQPGLKYYTAKYAAKPPSEVLAAQQGGDVQQASQNLRKGSTDLEKLTGKEERRKSYGADIIGDMGRTLGGDTTLASGSLLSLGNTLGQ